MSKRKASKIVHNHIKNISPLSSVNKFKSVRSISKLANVSRQSHSQTNLATSKQLRTNRNSQRSHLTSDHFKSDQNTLRNQASHPLGQYSYNRLLYPRISAHVSPYSIPSSASSKILVIEDVENKMRASKSIISVGNNVPKGDSDSAQLLEKISVNFDDVESHQAKFVNNEASQAKAKKFVMAWRAGLSYPRTKKKLVLTDIPIAATSHCKTGITSCTRCYRRHLNRLARSSNESLLADLVHKESLEKFIEETEQFHATSSIVIKEDLKRQQLYDSVHHADSAEKVDKDGQSAQPSEDDMQLTIKFNVPPPVHIQYIPEKSLFEKDMQRMADLGLLNKKSGEIRQSFSFTRKHKSKSSLIKHK